MMCPKKSEIPSTIREKIIFLHESGKSYREIGRNVKLGFSTVRYIIKRFLETGKTENKQRSGRPKKLTVRERQTVIRDAQKNPFASAQSISAQVATSFGKIVHPQTIRNVLHSANIHGRAARKKPFISEKNRLKRLEFAKAYITKPMEFWRRVIFSDESKFNLFGSDGKRFVWRKPNTELHSKNLKATVKHGGGHVMVWGCMSSDGVGNITFIEGTMTAKSYIDVLQDNLSESSNKLGLDGLYYFQQDNDPKHTARITQEWLLTNVPHRLITPPQSPDMNPIENLWSILDSQIRRRAISNKNSLKEALIDEWSKITSETTTKLIDSMPRRLQAVIDAKGMHTKY